MLPMSNGLRRRIDRSLSEAESRLVDAEALERTVQRLVADGDISGPTAASLRAALRSRLADCRYILRHLGAHAAIGAVFAFDLVPLPLGTIARVSWVAGNRVVETARGRRERARLHSAGVLLLAAIPWLGYAAYLLPLRRHSHEVAFVLANHSWIARRGKTYEEFLRDARAPVRRFGRWLVPLPPSGPGLRPPPVSRTPPAR